MAIETNQELYFSIRSLIDVLNTLGERDLANDLHDALTSGCLPGEILGEIRIVLKRIRLKPKNECAHVYEHVNDAIGYIDRALSA